VREPWPAPGRTWTRSYPAGNRSSPADTPAGAAELYPDVVAALSQLCVPAAKRAAKLLAPVSGDVLDVGAGAAPWSIPLAAADPCHQSYRA